MQTFENLFQNYSTKILRYGNLNIANLICKTFENNLLQNFKQNSQTNNLWVGVIKVCLNIGGTYIIGEIMAKDNLNKTDLMQNLRTTSSLELMYRILRYCTQIVLVYI